jgi:glycosyltransferase involved in cell wall biosynthesis
MLTILIPNRNEKKILEMMIALEEQFPKAQIIVAVDRDSRGKGWAVRKALEQAEGDIICFIDGDMDIHPRMIWRLIPFIDDYDIVVGKKNIPDIFSRKVITILSRIFIKVLFGLSVDTQTGIKMFRRGALMDWYEEGWMFDLEILAKANIRGFTMVDVPVEAKITRKMRGSSVLKAFMAAIKIRSNI